MKCGTVFLHAAALNPRFAKASIHLFFHSLITPQKSKSTSYIPCGLAMTPTLDLSPVITLLKSCFYSPKKRS